MLLEDDHDMSGPPRKKHHIGVDGRSSFSRHTKLAAIVGIGGVGKTTLAQLVYNDSKVQEHFDIRSWVWVSRDFDTIRLTRAIIESVTDAPCNLVELESLQKRLVAIITGKKVFLVLDDVWDEGSASCEMLLQPLVLAAAASRVMVTTRNQLVATAMDAQFIVHLEGLDAQDSWTLFWRVVLPCDDCQNAQNVTPELKAVGWRIVEKSHGVPLVVRAVGALLSRNTSLELWEDVATSDLWELDMAKEHVMPILRLSYDYLPAHLKPCFRFCGGYPRGHEFQAEELARLWCALGFARDSGLKKMEAVACSYIDEFVQRSFLSRSTPLVLMHDLVYDLAQSIEKEAKCATARNGSCVVHCNVFLHDANKVHHGSCSLRSVLIDIHGCEGSTYYLERSLFESGNIRNLRVLDMSGDFVTFNWTEINLPESVGELKHLRYLSLCQKTIPDFICKLYKLQTLVNHSADTLYLPNGIWKLNKLRNLLFPRMSPVAMPRGINGMTNLQALSAFTVSKVSSDVAILSALGDLDGLQGELRILELQNITNKRVLEAAEANLSSKRLTQLALEWNASLSEDPTPYPDEQVLNSLRPNTCIGRLRLSGYRGASFPTWLSDNSFRRITHVEIVDCNHCECLPALGQLTGLKQLKLEGLKKMKTIDAEFYGIGGVPFPSLQKLQCFGMEEWKTWWPAGNLGAFPALQDLVLMECKELVALPVCNLQALTELTVTGCKNLSTLKQIEDHCKLVIRETYAGKSSNGLKSHDQELRFQRESSAQQPCFLPSLATVRTEDWYWRSRVGFRRFWRTGGRSNDCTQFGMGLCCRFW
uniref:Uncharacterized protein n=1 Tax=Arundo donax TaxID=35708 RepID=A0A0A9BVP8_ARUDO